jgi:hypothetical protein
VLLTEPIEVGAQRILSAVLCPEAGCQEMDLKGGVGIEALEPIDEVPIRIHSLQVPQCWQYAWDRGRMMTHRRPAVLLGNVTVLCGREGGADRGA